MHVYLHHIQYKLRHLITQANRFWCELPLLHVWDEIVILRNFVYMFQFYLDIVIWIEQINCYLTKYVYMNYISMKCTIGVQEKFKDTKGVSRRRQSQNDRTIPWPKDQEHRRRQSQNDRTMTKRTRADRHKNRQTTYYIKLKQLSNMSRIKNGGWTWSGTPPPLVSPSWY
jgi:hypothetical protein